MPALRFFVRRTLALLLMLLVLSLIVFGLLYLAPGDLVRNLVGNKAVTPELVAAVRAKYHLDDGFFVQYWYWLSDAVRGNFGVSVRTGLPVTQMLAQRVPVSAVLATGASALAVGAGIPLGIIAAKRKDKFLDKTIVNASIVGISAPSFAIALLLIYIFAVMLGWFPLYGVGNGGLDLVVHMVLPCIALSLGVGATVVKITRTAILSELGKDHISFAISRGLPAQQIRWSLLRGASLPILTSAGLVLASVVGGSILVETTFAIPGVGVLLADSISFKDIPVVQALTLLVAFLIAGATFLVDIVTIAIDPRLRLAQVKA